MIGQENKRKAKQSKAKENYSLNGYHYDSLIFQASDW